MVNCKIDNAVLIADGSIAALLPCPVGVSLWGQSRKERALAETRSSFRNSSTDGARVTDIADTGKHFKVAGQPGPVYIGAY